MGMCRWNPGTLKPLAYTVEAEVCHPILELTSQIPPSIDTIEADLRKFKLADLTFFIVLSGNYWFP